MYGNQKKHCQVDDEKDKAFSHHGVDLLVGLYPVWDFKKGSVFEFLPFFRPLAKIQKHLPPDEISTIFKQRASPFFLILNKPGQILVHFLCYLDLPVSSIIKHGSKEKPDLFKGHMCKIVLFHSI